MRERRREGKREGGREGEYYKLIFCKRVYQLYI